MAGASAGPPLLYRSTVHPDPIKWQVYVALVAIDLGRAAVHLMAGKDEPKSDSVPADKRPGVIPTGDLGSLLAVFNGGFMSRHGKFGMMVDGAVFLPPNEESCTVGLGRDGTVRIAPWPEISPKVGELNAYRQTPPCLIQNGTLHDLLQAPSKTKKWGAAEGGRIDVRRSAIGVANGGRTLIYGSGEDVTARDLALGMQAAGAVVAAELDINYSYTRFLTYGPGDPPAVSATLVPKTKFGKTTYVKKPAERDFFYVTRQK